MTIKVTMILYFILKRTGEDMLRTCVWSTAAAAGEEAKKRAQTLDSR